MLLAKRKYKKNASVTEEEDKKLLELVRLVGERSWNYVSLYFNNRTPRWCKERYDNILNPMINRNPWLKSEDDLLLSLVHSIGTKWTTISSYFNNRTPLSLKNRYKTLTNRMQAKVNRDNTYVNSSPEILQENIENSNISFDFADFEFENDISTNDSFDVFYV